MFINLKNTFKIISVLSPVLLATFFIKPDVALAGGFSQTCSFIFGFPADGRYQMRADCVDKRGNRKKTSIDISDYIANYNGNLAWASLGKFNASCEQIEINGNELKAKCKDATGALKDTSINLDEKISNQDGVLAADF
ncbi:CVNH domain-containing protein [Nostoc sp. ChiVER01]|uniref:mannose-binding lectin n=1 Tax=Nostoc sp. ChiVER01 TaxID=3075382 RepID=UPI002AD2EDA8|nr:CVNH domain-containing protein [Nostoc sp. ChiVER01]MDZ8227937.1 CVNH domain-containing protein [Nostoc sp. ChiVER01]